MGKSKINEIIIEDNQVTGKVDNIRRVLNLCSLPNDVLTMLLLARNIITKQVKGKSITYTAIRGLKILPISSDHEVELNPKKTIITVVVDDDDKYKNAKIKSICNYSNYVVVNRIIIRSKIKDSTSYPDKEGLIMNVMGFHHTKSTVNNIKGSYLTKYVLERSASVNIYRTNDKYAPGIYAMVSILNTLNISYKVHNYHVDYNEGWISNINYVFTEAIVKPLYFNNNDDNDWKFRMAYSDIVVTPDGLQCIKENKSASNKVKDKNMDKEYIKTTLLNILRVITTYFHDIWKTIKDIFKQIYRSFQLPSKASKLDLPISSNDDK